MKKIVISIFIFSFLLILFTFLNYEIEVLDTKISKINIENKKLETELTFLKNEWEYINTPKNINTLSNVYLNYQVAELIELKDFLEIILKEDNKSE